MDMGALETSITEMEGELEALQSRREAYRDGRAEVDPERLDRTIERIEVILGELRALRSDMLGGRPAEKD